MLCYDFINQKRDERIEKCQWSTYFKPTSSENNIDNVNLSASFEDEITNENNQPLTPVDIWLDRQIIVPMLCKHKEVENIGGKELEEKLMDFKLKNFIIYKNISCPIE